MYNLKSLLNTEQYQAASQIEGPFLILAGAGSGKTRVITYKIVNMIHNGIKPDRILAVTFTNKAAKEMKERVAQLLKQKKIRVIVTTFHSLGVRILKKEITSIGYREKFSIYDEKDCNKLLKDIITELKLPLDKYDPYEIKFKISHMKMNLSGNVEDNNLKQIYNKYQQYLKIYSAVDFDDLIKLPIEIFTTHPHILEKYQKKWKYILVDEYQDTSIMQYQFVKMLAIKHRNISVVGDDDQSIYSWRGANPNNLYMFETDFYPVEEIHLEQNYRCSGNILKAANTVIKYNTQRKSKILWTDGSDGELIGLYTADDENSEAEFVSHMVKKYLNEGYKLSDMAVLFRMNSQSRALEEVFREHEIEYKMIGAMNFFDRAEIRDIIGYMRFLANIEDEVALVRIINNPKRGIGNTTLMALMEYAKEKNASLYSTLKDFVELKTLGKRTTSYLEDFYNLIEKYREMIFKPRQISRTIQALVEEIDYRGKLINELRDAKKVSWRMNNINQLYQSITRYEKNPDNFEPNVFEYLQRISLNSRDEDNADGNKDEINMLSIHSAKGLEFKIVFLVGVEEGLIPHHKTVAETGTVEEERRLFYVAITRAKEKLIMSYPKMRMKFNEVLTKTKSSFIQEMPEEIIEEIDLENKLDSNKSLQALLSRWKKEK